MFWRALLLASVMVAVASSGVLAQAVTKEDLENALTDLKKDLIRQVNQNTTDIDNLSERVADLQKDFSGAIQRLDSVTEQTGSGNWVPNILGNMSRDRQFEQQMDHAVNRSIHKSGEVVVTNHMGSWQTVVVNGQYRSIAPGGQAKFGVPVGTVTTELPGYEGPKNWTVGAPDYRQNINIRPRHSTYYAPSNGSSQITYSVPAQQSYVVPSAPIYYYYNTWYYDPWVYDPWYFAWY